MWATEGRNAASLQAFFDGLTKEQKASIRAVSIDMSAGYEKAITQAVPDAQVCFDPFHVVQLGSKATDQVRREEYNRHGRSSSSEGEWIKGTRYSLLKDTAKQTPKQLPSSPRSCSPTSVYRAFLLYGELRYLYKIPNTKPPSASTPGSRGPRAPAETVRQTRPNDPQTQTGGARRGRARDE